MRLRSTFFLLVAAICLQAALCQADEPSVLVRTAPLKRGRIVTTVTSYGVVALDPRQTVTISFPRPGRVVRLLVTAGQTVRRHEPLLTFATDPAALQGFRQAETALAFAQGELARTERMAAQKLATRSQLAAARKEVTDAQAALDAQSRLGMGCPEAQSLAPFAGIVAAVTAREGDLVAAGTPLLQLSRRGGVRVELGVEPEDSGAIRTGMSVRLVSVFDPKQALTGTVAEVHGVVDPQTRLVEVIVRLPRDRAARLIPGTRLKGEIAIAAASGWLVPRQALLRDAQGAYLFQVDGGHARQVRVTTSGEKDGMVAVRGAFDPRHKVVVLGNYELADGMAVREGTR